MNYLTKTRNLYLKQHLRISKNDQTFNRIYGIYKNQNYGLEDNWFKNKTVLDAGCGNFGALTVRLSKLKCAKIHAFDIGKDWIKHMKKSLKKRKVNLSNIFFQTGDILDVKYKKNY